MARPVRIYLSVCPCCLKNDFLAIYREDLRAMCLTCVTAFPLAGIRTHECSRDAGSVGYMCISCSGVFPLDERCDYVPTLQCEQCRELHADVSAILVHECQAAPILQVNVPVSC